ncbi:GmrSD restriction endonuclease domain-containing protein [Vibrio coralliilyticus]|uniref:GmrSD restriction endonuclease domain-containing protein n=1 Tax=Vibrio coralliilyticus TaxID=190893 RepID=UPI001E632F62|nr:DUF262 domain-containing protein [Vibrio coralliilyticus]MCC2523571.1 DUF262 domain-containing protein [Vibrio coralliilyticus]
MNLPEPKNLPYKALLADIEKGLIKIPQFQRDYVWTKDRAAGLIDSILKGYPIGTFITWKTKEQLRVVKDLGGVELPPVPEGDFAEYVLDGQQRMTSLFCALKGVTIQRGNKLDDFSAIYVDLNADEHEQIVVTDVSELEEGQYISLTDLINAGFTVLAQYDATYHEKLEEYKQTIQGYNFSLIEVKEAPLDVATEIFTRINVGGKPLTLFEIMVAKTFDAQAQFDLSERFEALVERLREVSYDTISDATVLQTVSLVMGKECKRQNILRLEKERFIEEWPKVVEAIEAAVDYFRGYYRIPVSRLLPYNSLLAPFAYFFYHHKDKPLNKKQKFLEDFFWRVSLSGRYSSSVEGKLAQDIKRIDQMLSEQQPGYDWTIDTSAKFIQDNGWFNAGRSYIKALLCIMAYQRPVSFIDGAIVHISNDWLKRANSRNYHHYFPRAFLRKQGLDDSHSNHIANIAIVDDFLNKREIGAKAPSVYMDKFAGQNSELDAHMLTHLIELDGWGIWDNDYPQFLQKRCEKLSIEIQNRLLLREQDKNAQQSVNTEDIDELAQDADF